MMRKALVVGINHYEHCGELHGCVDDAHAVKAVLERHSDGKVNFGVKLLTGTGPSDPVTNEELRAGVEELFKEDSEIALFYFAGHGYIEVTGGYLLTSEIKPGNIGLSLNDVLAFANKSAARNKVIILDSCHSGITGSRTDIGGLAELKEGTSILTASTADQYAVESSAGGIFTSLLVDALSGSAGNLVGDVTPGSIYAHIDQSLGPWQQRPVFKTNVKNFVSLRKVQPPISLADLQRIKDFFPTPGFEFKLDPSYEPERTGAEVNVPPPDPHNTEKFAVLQNYNRVNLLVPVDAPHMWHAAMESKSCRLTVLGEHYHRLAEQDLI